MLDYLLSAPKDLTLSVYEALAEGPATTTNNSNISGLQEFRVLCSEYQLDHHLLRGKKYK